jgi:hypothetical protein
MTQRRPFSIAPGPNSAVTRRDDLHAIHGLLLAEDLNADARTGSRAGASGPAAGTAVDAARPLINTPDDAV